jgi:hypothetical protein
LQLQPPPPTLPASVAGGAALARRHDLAAEPSCLRPRRASPGPPADAPAGALERTGSAIARAGGSGFVIHQLLAALPELRGPPPDMPRTIGAYRAHLALRVHYSGPVAPVDLRV